MAKKEVAAREGSAKGSVEDQKLQERLAELREEYNRLHEKKIATERDRQNLEERLKELREQAEREYGTSDLEELRRLLDERRRENERMVAEYQQHVESIRARLREIEKTGSEESS
ncbi:MAG: hypothetical protein GX443_03585 [Deltaproteobacteria bacterium]|nr:hypothetical protein [Deltaproteobacteria bacterium]